MAIGFSILLVGAWMNGNLEMGNLLRGALVYGVTVMAIVLMVIFNYVEITGSEVICYRFPFTYRAPIKNVIGLGFPKQNYVSETYSSFMYIWYDDPKNPGSDKYINIKRGQFDDKTLVKIATDLKASSPDIKIDEKLQQLIDKYGA